MFSSKQFVHILCKIWSSNLSLEQKWVAGVVILLRAEEFHDASLN